MAALTYASVLERLHGDAGALLKAASEPLSDGLSTQHSCFRRTRGSGGSSGPFHLHMVFLRSRPSGMPALPHFTSICNTSLLLSHTPLFFFTLLFSHKLNFFSFDSRPTFHSVEHIQRQGGDMGQDKVTTLVLRLSTHIVPVFSFFFFFEGGGA